MVCAGAVAGLSGWSGRAPSQPGACRHPDAALAQTQHTDEPYFVEINSLDTRPLAVLARSPALRSRSRSRSRSGSRSGSRSRSRSRSCSRSRFRSRSRSLACPLSRSLRLCLPTCIYPAPLALQGGKKVDELCGADAEKLRALVEKHRCVGWGRGVGREGDLDW